MNAICSAINCWKLEGWEAWECQEVFRMLSALRKWSTIAAQKANSKSFPTSSVSFKGSRKTNSEALKTERWHHSRNKSATRVNRQVIAVMIQSCFQAFGKVRKDENCCWVHCIWGGRVSWGHSKPSQFAQTQITQEQLPAAPDKQDSLCPWPPNSHSWSAGLHRIPGQQSSSSHSNFSLLRAIY